MEGNAVLLADRPVFPLPVTVGDASITLQADGSVDGDVDAFRAAVMSTRSMGGAGLTSVVMWLLAFALPQAPHTVSKTGIGFE